MKCEFMVDNQTHLQYLGHSQGNPLRSDAIRIYRSSFGADEELEIGFRTWGEFERFTKWLHDAMWEQKNKFIESAKARRGDRAPSRRRR